MIVWGYHIATLPYSIDIRILIVKEIIRARGAQALPFCSAFVFDCKVYKLTLGADFSYFGWLTIF